MSCPKCFSGHINTDTPKGREAKIHGLDTYIAEPPGGSEPKGIIIMIPDAFGYPFVNNRIWADHVASAGNFRVYLPDFMGGNSAPVSMIHTLDLLFGGQLSIVWKPYYVVSLIANFIPFVVANRWSVFWPRVLSFFKSVRENEGASLPVGAAGFCWGGLHTIYLAHDQERAGNGKPLVDACFTAHPSRLNLPADIKTIRKPVSLAIGDKDMNIPISQIEEVKKVWANLSDVDTEVRVYKDAVHGFSIRAENLTPDAARKAEEAEKQAVDWYTKEFAKVSY